MKVLVTGLYGKKRQKKSPYRVGGGCWRWSSGEIYYKVTWLYISKNALKVAKQKIDDAGVSNKIKLLIGDATELNLKEKFDVIFSLRTPQRTTSNYSFE